MREQLEHLITMTTLREKVVLQVLPLGSGAHAPMGLAMTLYDFPPPAPLMLHFDVYGRGAVQDREAEASDATHTLGLLRAKASGHEESTEFIRAILSEQEESQHHAPHPRRVVPASTVGQHLHLRADQVH